MKILIAFILVFVVISVATNERVPAGVAHWGSASPSPAACCSPTRLPVGPVNPARTPGPALVAGHLDAVWVYLVGPIAGGVPAAPLYDCFIPEVETPDWGTWKASLS